MKPGKLRHKISLQRLVSSQDAAGQPVDTWTTLDSDVRCSIAHKTGRENDKTSGEHARVTTEIRFRYRNKLSDLKPDDRALDVKTGRAYNIQFVNNWEERNRDVVLICEYDPSA